LKGRSFSCAVGSALRVAQGASQVMLPLAADELGLFGTSVRPFMH